MSSQANVSQAVSAIRNVVLVGSAGSGKTTLYEHLLKSRVPGYRGEKMDPERTAALAVSSINVGSCVVTLLDAPGHPDFVGELRAGLRGADGAIFVISASDGVDAATEALWHECAAVGMPRGIAITKLDDGRSDFAAVLTQLQARWGTAVQPAYVPVTQGEAITGNLSLVSQSVHDYSSGKRVRRDASPDEIATIEEYRAALVEGIIQESEDDSLMDRYLEGDVLKEDELVEDLTKAIYTGRFFPVVPVNSLNEVGTEELLTVIKNAFPNPSRHRLTVSKVVGGAVETIDAEVGDLDGPLAAEVIRTTSDQFAGRGCLVRIYNGMMQVDDSVMVSGYRSLFSGKEDPAHPDHADVDKIGPMSVPGVGENTPTPQAGAGQIVFVTKMTKAETSDTLSPKDSPVLVNPWVLPEPLLPVAIRAASRNDEDKLPVALNRLAVEDTTVRVETDPETKQTIVWTMGQAHSDLLLARLKDRYGVNVVSEPIKVALRETFVAPAAADGAHVKQSGGHGQYAKCSIEVEPLERGAGFEFVDKIVGGVIPRQFIPSVEKGIRAQLEKGVVAGYPMVDIRVKLVFGKYHPVDSSDMAFQMAGAQALREAAAKPGVTALLEPIDDVTVTVDEQYMGVIMTDVSGRRGQLVGTDADDNHHAIIHALIPQSELSKYAIDLRGLARGSGSFTREFHGYEIMPAMMAQQVIAAAKEPAKA
ncbi:MAG: elongation factor G-like protein EF-G2 [Propionibacteriaceae bacterium]|jgi:elongation factor G|nr:elongation factor G-like protein EF-G2 [Propionibacteriaceae bacterium]